MRFLVSFARGLQYRVLIPLVSKLSNAIRYALRHPLKSLFFIIKLYISLLLFMFLTVFLIASVSQSASANIYDRAANSVPTQPSMSCDFEGQSPAKAVAEFNSSSGLPKVQGSSYTDAATLISQGSPRQISQNNCAWDYTRGTSGGNINGDGNGGEVRQETYKSESNFVLYGRFYLAPSCDNLGTDASGNFMYPDHKHMGTDSNGLPRCYTAQDLEDADTCDLDNPDVIGSSDSPSMVCLTKPDGSKCAMKKYQVGDAFAYTQNLEPSGCYDGEASINPYEEPPLNPPAPNTCQDMGNGVQACAADPSDVCDAVTGVCESGCGTFDIGNGTHFICFEDSEPPEEPPECDPNMEICDDIEPPVEPPTCDATVTDCGAQYTKEITDLIKGSNTRLTTIGTGVAGIQTGVKEIKEELTTSKTVNYGIPVDIQDTGAGNDYQSRNYGTVISAAVQEMQNAPLTKSVNEFFEVSLSGTCPVYSTNVPYINATITIDQFCGSVMNSVWPIVSAIIILVFSVLGFRVAIL